MSLNCSSLPCIPVFYLNTSTTVIYSLFYSVGSAVIIPNFPTLNSGISVESESGWGCYPKITSRDVLAIQGVCCSLSHRGFTPLMLGKPLEGRKWFHPRKIPTTKTFLFAFQQLLLLQTFSFPHAYKKKGHVFWCIFRPRESNCRQYMRFRANCHDSMAVIIKDQWIEKV